MRAIWFSFAAGLAILGGFSASAEELGAGAPPSGYAEKLAAYEAARASFESEAGPYWQSVADKRRLRNEKRRKNEVVALEDYVLTQPPVYAGPPQPADPNKPGGEQPKADRPPIPVVADFVRNAEEQFGFVPDRPASERDSRTLTRSTLKGRSDARSGRPDLRIRVRRRWEIRRPSRVGVSAVGRATYLDRARI